jgi:hypothetical protein
MPQEPRIDALDEQLKLYRMQRERVSIDYKIEKSMKKIMPTLSADVRLLQEMFDRVREMQEEEATVDALDEYAQLPEFID